MNFTLLHESNLISFMGIPEDSSVTSIFSPLDGNISGLIGQGIASNNLGNGLWVGSLTMIEPTSGYWVRLDYPPVESFIIEAYPTDENQNYNLIQGPNIISYVGIDGMSVSEAIPDEYEERFMQDGGCGACGVIGEGEATILNPVLGWVGSLTTFNNLKGYWAIVDQNMDFNWNIPGDEDLVRELLPIESTKKPVPLEFIYTQSTQQAFYFVEDIHIDDGELLEDDWLIAYHDGTVIGARQWNGLFTDIPAMGTDGFDDTFGYIEEGIIPEFKLFRESTGELMPLVSDEIAPWINNGLTFITLYSQSQSIYSNLPINTLIEIRILRAFGLFLFN